MKTGNAPREDLREHLELQGAGGRRKNARISTQENIPGPRKMPPAIVRRRNRRNT